MYAIEVRHNQDDTVEFKLDAEQYNILREAVITARKAYLSEWEYAVSHDDDEVFNKADKNIYKITKLANALFADGAFACRFVTR